MIPRLLPCLVFAIALLHAPAANADFAAGQAAYARGEWARAVGELRPLSEAGDDRAMMLLGNMHNDGRGVMQNHAEALRLYRAAAAKGNADAMISLAAMYQKGTGVEQNSATASAWFGRAASLGDQMGAFFHAALLLRGDTAGKNRLRQDFPAAYTWFRIAGTMDVYPKFKAEAAEWAQRIEPKLSLAERQQADRTVKDWKPLAAAALGPPPADAPPPEAAKPAAEPPKAAQEAPKP